MTDGPITIAGSKLSLTVNPRVGGTITAITHLELGLSVLGTVPWDAVDAPIGGLAPPTEAEWLTRYTGGWPLLFPNGGDACMFDGVFHGFHGEGSIAPWRAAVGEGGISLTRRFFSVPVEMRRDLVLEGDVLVIRECVLMKGPRPIEIMWGHHPTFGSDLLAGPVEISTSARRASAEAVYDPPANPLTPGAQGAWPSLAGKAGPFDLAHPAGPIAASAYVEDFDQRAWIAMRRLDDAIGVALSWDASVFACAWLWYELGGTPEAPWHGRGNVIGLEPNTTKPALGLAEASRRGGRLLRLEPGADMSTELRLHVFKPRGAVAGVDADGRASRT
ncbi:MAG: hypothetical protein JNL61_04075 [Rhizobiaceae bacterium]|nr:hypothetical protein [Rhizobiaceae bacterium]